ncbi:MAG: phosphotransferase [Zoogloeaceae bacterium]|nr:phosphotransferase [Zoogloeaceae bacterium]
MRAVPAQELEDWIATGETLERDGRGPKVVMLEGEGEGLFLKIFHTRRPAWQTRLRPPALRFARNAKALRARGIFAPEVTECLWLDQSRGLSACLYRPLPGISLERLLRQDPAAIPLLLPDLARFIRTLHVGGIYFRSLHLGNILALDPGQTEDARHFGLIDILDLECFRRPLGPWRIHRNFRHLRRSLARRALDFPIGELRRLYDAA